MLTKLVLATNNRDKIREIRELLAGLKIEILTAADFPDFPEIEETGETLEENAVLKAEGIYRATGLPALADDSGLEVDFLGGAPGVLSSRYASPGCTYDDNTRKLLAALAGVSGKKRKARFRCVIAVCFGDGDTEMVEGTVDGYIAEKKSESLNGFGYDPGFYYPPLGTTFADLSLNDKNQVSHRGRALRLTRTLLEQRRGK